MSNTRHAPPGSTLKQNRFASSPDIERGLLGNLVARKCAAVESAAERELIFWLQSISHVPGGFASIAAQALDRYSARNPQPTEKAKLTREAQDESSGARLLRLRRRMEQEIQRQYWESFTQTFPDRLAELCLDPAVSWPDSYPALYNTLSELKAEHTAQAESSFGHTELSRQVWKEILDAQQLGGAVLLHNSAGVGKSHAAEACCKTYAGRARYALTPSTNDATGFWRTIAEAVGCASGQSFKCQQIRDRVIETLGGRDLVLVLDNCQFLFPVSDYRYALPNRVNWVLELAECGVPVVLIANSKLFDTLGFVEQRTGWDRSKFVNQLTRVVELPAGLEVKDVQTVAASLLPDGDRAAQRKLADFMISAHGYLHAGQPAAQRARRLATAHQRDRVTLADMTEAIDTWMVPAHKAMESGLDRADEAARRCKSKGRNYRPDTEAQLAAKAGKRRNPIVTSSDLAPKSGNAPRSDSAAALQAGRSATAGRQNLSPRAQASGNVHTPDRAPVADLVAG